MEHIWDALGRRLAARFNPPWNTQQLKQLLIVEWASLPQELLDNLVLIRPVSIETESLKYNDMGLLRGPVNREKIYPSNSLINIHWRERLILAAT
ncbi:hypothetical protein TNCV_1453541 [Trichonephila clavipes]|nr:hypothetical protein TNCV_1453541 [Trichonephila clavipes]